MKVRIFKFGEFLDLFKVFKENQIEAVIFDNDQTMVKTEAHQELTWLETLLIVIGSLESKTSHLESILEASNIVKEAFKTGQFSAMIDRVYQRMQSGRGVKMVVNDLLHARMSEENTIAARKWPVGRPIDDPRQLDEIFMFFRVLRLLDFVKRGDITLFHGVPEILTALHKANLKVGMYTTTPEQVAKPLTEMLFGKTTFDELIPKQFRLYGVDKRIMEDERKPHPKGWTIVAGEMGYASADQQKRVALVDDRPIVLRRALNEAGFRVGFGLYGQEAKLNDWRIEFGNGQESDIELFLLPELAWVGIPEQ